MTTVTQIMQATFGRRDRSKRAPMWSITQAVAAAATLAAAAAAAGCTASSDDVRPDPNRIFFPTGLVASPDGTKVFVTNANSDLTYDSGTIGVVPLAEVEAVIGPWLAGGGLTADPPDPDDPSRNVCDVKDGDGNLDRRDCCAQDADFTETLECDEARFLYLTRRQGVRIGNFATDIALQDFDGGRVRLVVPTRGDPSVAWADWDPEAGQLTCDASGGGFQSCDDAHRLSFVHGDADVGPLPEEPFGVFADKVGQFAVVTHLTSGAVTLIDSRRDGLAQIADVQRDVFATDPTTGLRGATSVAGRNPKAPDDIIYVGSRSEDKIQTFTVGRPVNDSPPILLSGSWFFLDAVGNNTMNPNANASDSRGMAFSPTGDRLYLLNRKPPTLQILDTSIGPTGVPRNQVIGVVDVCRQASALAVADPGDGERVYLTCFQDGQIYVIDPRGRGHVEDVITVGSGPYGVAAAADGKRLYVTNFLEDTIAVVDLTPGSPRRNRVVLRIGQPRSL
jgi:YVTN family beta-propeller protein